MPASVTLNGSVTLDESSGLQVGGVAVGSEDNNDNDVNPSSLPSTFYTRLSSFTESSHYVGAAGSAADLITVTSDGTVVNLGFSQADGTALPVYGGGGTGVSSGLTAVNGGAITLFADSVLGNRMVLGVDSTGDIVFALYMEPNSTLSAAKIWMAQFEAITNTVTTNPDDPMVLGGLGVAAGSSMEFNFNALPSGQNLFGTVGTTSSGLVVIGKVPVLNADGTFTNASNTINTSQGGGPTTIGVNNQMFDAGEGAYFTFVKSPVANYLAGAVNGLDQNEADDADNIQYTGGTLEVTTSYTKISQIQGNSLATMKITASNINDSPQGQAFVSALGSGSAAPITAVRVFNAAGTKIEDTADLAHFNAAAVAVTITSGVATVSGLGAGYKIEWDTSVVHDQVLIEAVAGKFDIGGFGTNETSSSVTPLNNVRFEDDGPTISASATGAPTLTVDETTLATDATGAFAAQFTAVFGTDGQGATPRTYALSTPGGDSGLVDTATGEAVMLSLASGKIEGRTASSNDLVFTVSVDASGNVTLDQLRAVVHPTADPDESKSLSAANLVVLTATATDGDGDTASAPLNIGQLLVFKDDGPSIVGSATGAPTLTVDESAFATDATGAFAAQFTPTYGADGAGATPTTYALSTPGGNSGLVDTATGQAVVLSLVSGKIEGRTATSNDLVFTVSVDSSGNVTLDQLRAIVHPTTDPDETKTLSAANLVVLTATAHDKDGDSAPASLDIGQLLVFKDDGPSIGPIPDGLVDFVAGSTVTKSLSGVVGADPNAAPYTLTDYTSSITVNGVSVHGVLANDAHSVTYWADTNNDGTFGNTGDTAYYKLTLGETGAGTYTFDVLVSPPPANLDFNFNALPSGQNLFGTVGTTADGLVVIGKVPVLNPDGTFTNASNTINTSQGGGPTTIGVNNQMFDAGEGAYFTFVKSPVANYLAGAVNGLDQNEADDADNIQYTGGTLEVSTSFTKISQIQGNSLATMKITASNINDSPQGQAFVSALGTGSAAPITAVRVFNAAGVKIEDTADLAHFNAAAVAVTITSGVATVSGLGAGYKIEWDTSSVHDQVLIEDVAGKFDIGGFGAVQVQPTPDQKLDFVAKVLDGDGDYSTDAFSVGIDGTGIYDDGVVAGLVGVP